MCRERRGWDLRLSPGEHHAREGKEWTGFRELKHFGSGQKSKTQTMRAQNQKYQNRFADETEEWNDQQCRRRQRDQEGKEERRFCHPELTVCHCKFSTVRFLCCDQIDRPIEGGTEVCWSEGV